MWLVLCPSVLDTHPAGHGGRRGGCCPFGCHDTRQCFHNTAFLLSGQADLDGFPCMMLFRLERAPGPLGIAMLSFVCESLTPAQARLVQKLRLKIERGRSRRKTRGWMEGIECIDCLPCFLFFVGRADACPWDPGSCREQGEKVKDEKQAGSWWLEGRQWLTSAAQGFRLFCKRTERISGT